MSNDSDDQIIKVLEKCGGNKSEAARELGIPRSTLRHRLRLMAIKETPKRLDVHTEHRVVKENRILKQRLQDALETSVQTNDIASIVSKLSDAKSAPPKWVAPKRPKGAERSIITACLSDTHFDELVDPAQINFVNAYNRDIAVARLQRFFENLIRLSRDYINGIKIEGLVMPMLGDMVSGNIHEELKETNEDQIINTCLFYSDHIISGVRMLLAHFDKIYIPCVVGNHGRMDKKPKAKHRAHDSFDYLIYHLVARAFKGVPEVTFGISDGSDMRYDVYSTRYQLTHGDQFRGGTGIAGIFSPIMLGDARKRKREQVSGTPYDFLVMGHFHKRAHLDGIIINGSTKGYDEWTSQMNFGLEPPQQTMWLTDPKWGKTIDAPIHVLGDDEDWRNVKVEVAGF